MGLVIEAFGASRAVIEAYRAIIYSGPSKKSRPLGKMPRGKKLIVSNNAKNGFHRVKLKNRTAWIYASDIRMIGSVRKYRQKMPRKKAYRRRFPHRAPKESRQATRSSIVLPAMKSIRLGPTVHLIGQDNGIETIVGSSVSTFWSYGIDYSFNLNSNLRMSFGMDIPFTQYATEDSAGNEITVTVTGFLPTLGLGYILNKPEFRKKKYFLATVGARLGFLSMGIKRKSNSSEIEYSGSGLLLYLPEIQGLWKIGSSLGLSAMLGYRISMIDKLKVDSTGQEFDAKLSGILGAIGLLIWL